MFWHTPSPAQPASSYESALLGFHAALTQDPPAGFVASWTSRISAASWMPGSAGGYEDWYLVEDFAALDALNRAAVSGTRAAPHDRAAEHAATGTAGLYRLWIGDVDPAATSVATDWLAKPADMTYDRWWEALSSALGAEVAVWQRQMTLGPTPEFAVRSAIGDAGLPWLAERVTSSLLPD